MEILTMNRSLATWTRLSPALFDDFGKEMGRFMEHFLEPENGGGKFFAPHVDIAETDVGYQVSVDLPGMKPDDFNLEFKEGQLWITGERKTETEEKNKTYHRVERRYGQFRRVISLGTDVDVDKVSAEYKDGVLHVTVPKAPSVQPRRIAIKS